ncbi:unnamed protein product [Protopolystoma xenopodis]|uniref:Laminin EGF-like domain-containing protein n=1 Tax=Protopolystoma xenopodis TaxID=117903 RepID=A0A3S5FDL7_9PLAT|nr:unnamed protein product [Protopolystoma xenopodis]
MSGYFGEARLKNCRPCQCSPEGSVAGGQTGCDRLTGQCQCLPNVHGQFCYDCRENHFNLTAGIGCQACYCDKTGSVSQSCNPVSQ